MRPSFGSHDAHHNNGGKRLNVTSASATVGDLTAEEKREGDEDVGSLPRTLSTSVLRIKHRRSFWEKVVGYVDDNPFIQSAGRKHSSIIP